MNIYRKIQQARAMLQAGAIKKSGENKFAGYDYLELGDFLPRLVDICADLGLCPVISFSQDVATLRIVNADNPTEEVVVSSPMSSAALKGCHEVQNLGAVQTYLRRYLYVAAFDIVEHDALDSTTGKDAPDKPARKASPAPASPPPNPAQAASAPPPPGDTISPAQGKLLGVKLKQSGMPSAAFKAKFKIERMGELKKDQMTPALKFLEEYGALTGADMSPALPAEREAGADDDLGRPFTDPPPPGDDDVPF